MKKRIFKAYWLVALTICMLASCTSQKEEIETNNTTPNEIVARKNVRSRSTLPPVSDIYDLPAYIGALHNAGIYAFIDYVNANNLSPFIECDFTDDMIEEFAEIYTMEHLEQYTCLLEVEVTDTDSCLLSSFGELLTNIIMENQDVESINNLILEQSEDFYTHNSIEASNRFVYNTIKEIALATNRLWGCEWDYTQPSFTNPDPNVAYSSENNNDSNNNDNNNNDNNDNNQKTDDEIRELKIADIAGAVEGAIEGAITGVGGGLAGMATGAVLMGVRQAVKASIIIYIAQELVEHATIMRAEFIIPNTYMYYMLVNYQATNPEEFYSAFGNKYDNIIN